MTKLAPSPSGPPYEFTIEVSSDVEVGEHHITAVGAATPGQPMYSPSVMLFVERAENPVRVWIEPTKIPVLRVGGSIPLLVVGRYSDGDEIELWRHPQVTYGSEDPNVAKVSTNGIVTASGAGVTRITVFYRDMKVSTTVTVGTARRRPGKSVPRAIRPQISSTAPLHTAYP